MFTEEQKHDIRHALGFPDVYRDGNTRLESAITVIGNRPETKAKVIEILEQIAAILSRLDATTAGGVISFAGLKRVDEIEFYNEGSSGGTTAQDSIKKLGRLWTNRLSIIFGIEIVNDIFSGRGYSGDGWASYGFQYGGSGGIVPLG